MTAQKLDTRVDTEDYDEVGNTFDKTRKTIGLIVGPLIFLMMLLLPLPITDHQQSLAAVMALVFILWVTEALPIPASSLLAIGLCVVLQVPDLAPDAGDSADFIYSAFSSSTLFLVIGGFILARAMTVHGLDRRFALFVLSIPGVAKSTFRVAIAFGLIAALISAFISNSAAAAMLLPLGVGIVRAVGPEVASSAGIKNATKTKFATSVMLMIAYGASVGGLLTPIGSTANVVGLGFLQEQTGTEISFLRWSSLTAPIAVVLFIVLCIVLLTMNKPEIGRLHNARDYVLEERGKLGQLNRGEWNTLACFILAIIMWVGPSVLSTMEAEPGSLLAGFLALDIGTAAVLAASLLFFLPTNWPKREFTLSWKQAANIDWGTVLLVGAGLVLGALMFNTGLAEVVGTGMAEGLGLDSRIAVVVLSVILAIVISETTSNTASVGVVVPIVIPIALAVGLDPTIPALAAVFGASCGFMLPVSTPPNAIVYGSGMVPITKMFRTGLVFDIIAVVVVSAGVLVTSALNPLS
ncbi:DASS family sodium-coupled anion symporter [Arthrobacter sp. EH-1B-1]|uniref:Sodium-dependent dicarboxylate transporter SdcS n=1 Tax=Arthrobacter vasquezii TaxID=2977629 RepID=A0ABT6CVU4_9MICC|nr:DASS family sodium-coupled anion symporter [Arthrobacter vasquezii]MDF9277617.1 DASS family sodium-coupled anion symporter [Arthrobacter vasquezii]